MFSTLLHESRWHLRMCKHFILRVWSKISVKISRLTKRYVLTILYYVVLPIIALSGHRVSLEKPLRESEWHNWSENNELKLIFKQSGKNWVFNYMSWAFRSKNVWAVFLLPFILILKITEEPSGGPPPESLLMYTLY